MSSKKNGTSWPVMSGTYQVGDPNGPVAVCALTSEKLVSPLVGVQGVAIAGIVYTANLGITRIIVNITSNPAIRFLLICGKDSALFRPGQSLVALSEHGIDDQRRIVQAAGYDPVLPSIDPEQVAQFRRQVEVLDWTGEEDIELLQERIKSLAVRNPGVFVTDKTKTTPSKSREEFVSIRPGGQREPLIYDPKGYFVITIEPEQREVMVRHYLPDHTPAHEMRGRGATWMLLGLLRDGLVTQLSHAGYLGEELAKAQTALQFGLRYDQDRLLRPRESPEAVSSQATGSEKQSTTPLQAAPKRSFVDVSTLKQLETIAPNTDVDLFLSVTDLPGEHVLGGIFVEPDVTGSLQGPQRNIATNRDRMDWSEPFRHGRQRRPRDRSNSPRCRKVRCEQSRTRRADHSPDKGREANMTRSEER
jgi:tetrahydromethanopterin S-methyltransferase subunit A